MAETRTEQEQQATSGQADSPARRERYERLVGALYQDVYRYGFWLCKSQPLAEDLAQETFLRAWRSLDSLQNDDAAKPWLFTILRRENARLYERYRPELVDVEEQVVIEEESTQPEHRMERKWLLRAINQLEKDYRDPLLLQIIGGFNGNEIAAVLGLNVNTVMTRLFRARSKVLERYNLGIGRIALYSLETLETLEQDS